MRESVACIVYTDGDCAILDVLIDVFLVQFILFKIRLGVSSEEVLQLILILFLCLSLLQVLWMYEVLLMSLSVFSVFFFSVSFASMLFRLHFHIIVLWHSVFMQCLGCSLCIMDVSTAQVAPLSLPLLIGVPGASAAKSSGDDFSTPWEGDCDMGLS